MSLHLVLHSFGKRLVIGNLVSDVFQHQTSYIVFLELLRRGSTAVHRSLGRGAAPTFAFAVLFCLSDVAGDVRR